MIPTRDDSSPPCSDNMAVRCVLWFKVRQCIVEQTLNLWNQNQQLPIWRVIEAKAQAPMRLNELPWLVQACEGVQLTPVERYLVDEDIWASLRLDTDYVSVGTSEHTVLLRLLGVDVCPLFGLELESIHRDLGLPPPPAAIVETDNRTNLAVRHIRVAVWQAVSISPLSIPMQH